MKNIYFPFLLFAMQCLLSCNKQKISDETTCGNIKNVTLTADNTVKVGQTLHFGTQEVGGYRVYEWRGPDNFFSQIPEDSILDAGLQNEGWYYLHLFNPAGSCEKIDSIYIDVQLDQKDPPCMISNNTTSYKNLNLGGDSYSSVMKRIESTFSQKALIATNGIYSSMTIYFHTHWRSVEPEDGIYFTTDSPNFDQADDNYNKVFIANTKSNIYWSSNEDQPVYISHVGTKLQVRFCNLLMGGNNGTSYQTSVSGNLVEK